MAEASPACRLDAVIGEDARNRIVEQLFSDGEHRALERLRFCVVEQPSDVVVMVDAREERLQLVVGAVNEQVA